MSVDIRNTWGPAISADGKWFFFMGMRRPMPQDIKDASKFVSELQKVEKLAWASALPEERKYLFYERLRRIQTLLPSNWATHALRVWSVASAALVIVMATAKIRHKI